MICFCVIITHIVLCSKIISKLNVKGKHYLFPIIRQHKFCKGTPLHTVSQSMRSNVVLELCTKVKAIPIKLDADGKFVHQLLHPLFILFNAVYMGAIAVFMYGFVHSETVWDLQHLVCTSFIAIMFAATPSFLTLSTVSVDRAKCFKFFEGSTIGFKVIATMIVDVVVFYAGFIIFLAPMLTQSGILLPFLFGYLMVVSILAFHLFMLVLYMHISSLKNKCNAILLENILCTEDIKLFTQDYECGKYCLELPSMTGFTSIQINIILLIFLFISGSQYFPLGLPIISMAGVVGYIVIEMEDIYAKVMKIAVKGKEDAYRCGASSVELMQQKDAAEELGRSSPLTGWGFFTIEKNTITSMISITLTYTIILLQMKF